MLNAQGLDARLEEVKAARPLVYYLAVLMLLWVAALLDKKEAAGGSPRLTGERKEE